MGLHILHFQFCFSFISEAHFAMREFCALVFSICSDWLFWHCVCLVVGYFAVIMSQFQLRSAVIRELVFRRKNLKTRRALAEILVPDQTAVPS